MKSSSAGMIACTALLSISLNATAQSPYGQPPDPQAILGQMPHMQDMQKFQANYDNIKKQREQERKAVTDRIYAEELAKAKKSPEVNKRFYDPYAVSEVEARKRLAPLSEQWKKEDLELEATMREDMMNNTSMGEMYKMQQEMMKQYGYTAPE